MMATFCTTASAPELHTLPSMPIADRRMPPSQLRVRRMQPSQGHKSKHCR